MEAPLALYLHVPFCASKCPYCDFYSGRWPEETRAAYATALTDEIKTLRRNAPFVDDGVFSRPLSSVYFGGGTPSLLGANALRSLLAAVSDRFPVLPDAEITVEVNPSLPDPEGFFSALQTAGVNRVSLGMQSAVETERKKLGRRSGKAEIERAVKAAQNAGIEDVSLDVMLGVPSQTKESLLFTLDFALGLGVTHLSAYLLKLEEGTPFFRRKDKLDLPSEDETADFYLLTCRTLEARGMRHYEVSNFCFGDKVGRHNMTYWRGGEYLGLGPGAHSFLGSTRFFEPPSLEGFLAGETAVYEGEGGDEEEKTMLALRTDLGAREALFKGKEEKLALFEANGLLTVRDGRVRLTDEGFLLSNAVIGELI